MASFLHFAKGKRLSDYSLAIKTKMKRDSSRSYSSQGSQQSQPNLCYPFRVQHIPRQTTPNELVIFFHNKGNPSVRLLSLTPSATCFQDDASELTAVFSVPIASMVTFRDAVVASKMSIDADFCGFTPLYQPTDRAAADVIALPGLAFHPFESWSAEESGGIWLQDHLPKSVSRARVLLYGYDYEQDRADIGLIDSLAARFKQDLLELYNYTQHENRPIVLLAHSTGCLILKKALCQMPTLIEQGIIQQVMFLGAPHDGLDTDSFRILADLHASRTEAREFCHGSPVITNLNRAFAPVSDMLKVTAFYETRKTRLLAQHLVEDGIDEGTTEHRLVDVGSAILFSSVSMPADCDHFGLAQIRPNHSKHFNHICDIIQAVINSILKPAGWRIQRENSITSPQPSFNAFTDSSGGSGSTIATSISDRSPSMSVSDASSIRKKTFFHTHFRRRNNTTPHVPPSLTLHHALRKQDILAARIILETFTDVDIKDPGKENRTALHDAALVGNLEVARALLDADAAVDPRTRGSFRTPLHCACLKGYSELARLLLDRGASANTRAGDKGTALHAAAEHGHFAVAKLLVERGVSLNVERERGYTALDLAVAGKFAEIVGLLRGAGGRVGFEKESAAPSYPGLC